MHTQMLFAFSASIHVPPTYKTILNQLPFVVLYIVPGALIIWAIWAFITAIRLRGRRSSVQPTRYASED